MHDRTVSGETLIFGNQGGLFMNAMTWWDHKTESVWSQPWGRAIAGPLKGTELELIPNQLAPWATWREDHPNTLALKVDGARYGRETFRASYVIGVTLGESATAFPYEVAAQTGIINDAVGPYPVVVHVDPEKRSVHVYLRQTDESMLTFVQQEDGVVQDQETGSTWQMDRGLAIDGPLRGQVLRSVPYIPAFPNAWRDFYPHSQWYRSTTSSPTAPTNTPMATPVVSTVEPPSPTPPAGGAADADVLYVKAVQATDSAWNFYVTVQHPDTGWDDYADGWDVLTPDGTIIKPDPASPFTRLLLHPHENEQPFTRSQSGIVIPPHITCVRVRAHDLVDGYGGREIQLDLSVQSGSDFEVVRPTPPP